MTGRRPPKPLQATSDLLINVHMGPPPQTSAYEKGSNTSCTIRPVLSFVASHCVRCDRRRGVMSGEVSRVRRDMRGTATLGIPARWSDATRLLERRALLFAEFSLREGSNASWTIPLVLSVMASHSVDDDQRGGLMSGLCADQRRKQRPTKK